MGTTETAGLREDFGGSVFEPGDDGYDDARSIFNSMIDRRPAVIAQCASADDIASALAHARANELKVAVRSGGHSVAGASSVEAGLVIDMRRMSAVEIDPDARIARVGGGATWADFDRAGQPHGLMTTGGRVSTTGVAGLTLGGGSTWLERKYGATCDHLVSVTLVTADGRQVTASEAENPELFWALHGGGANSGVATELVFRLSALDSVTLAMLLWPADAGPEVARRYRELIEDGAPEELGGALGYITGPPEEFVPDHLRGALVGGVIGYYAGPEAECREVLAPILELAPEVEMVAELPYAEAQCAIDDPPGYRNYWSAVYLARLPDEPLDAFCRRAHEMVVPSPSQHVLFPLGGALARQAGDWPMPYRNAPWAAHPLGLWEDAADDERALAWARGTVADMKPFAIEGVYLNFIADEGEDRVVAGYGRENYQRLAAVKAEFDPDNVFHLHHNIKPLQPA